MQILSQAFGEYGTNCYIVDNGKNQLIIDPGIGAKTWCQKHAKNAVAILLTHGHFDHVYDADELRSSLNTPIYLPKDDEVFISSDPFAILEHPFNADFLVSPNETLQIGDFSCTFHHFPGHTPGCSCIEIKGIDDTWFCGDFIFSGSIGRWDFEFSSASAMKASLQQVLNEKRNLKLYSGHGPSTCLDDERANIAHMLNLRLWQ